MRLLLDTHIFLWLLSARYKLTAQEWEIIDKTPGRNLIVSQVAAWEIAIKHAIGKLPLPAGFFTRLERYNITWLPHRFAHMESYIRLPPQPHHTDPFDRMLIAQAQSEGLTLLTRDKKFSLYDVPLILT